MKRLIMMLLIIATTTATEISYTDRSVRYCDPYNCSGSIYMTQEFFDRDGVWEYYNQSFFPCEIRGRDMLCTKDYNYRIESDTGGNMVMLKDGINFSLKLDSVLGFNLTHYNARISDTMIIYDVAENIELRYQYLPDFVKMYVVFKEPFRFQSESFNISYTIEGDLGAYVPYVFIENAYGNITYLKYHKTRTGLDIEIPARWFYSWNSSYYPLVVDPLIVLNGSYPSFEGYVTNDTAVLSPYSRYSGPLSEIKIGKNVNPFLSITTWYRASFFYYDLCSMIDYRDLRTVYRLNLTHYIKQVGTGTLIDFRQMIANHTYYSDDDSDCNGIKNCHFYIDMKNGTLYKNDVSYGLVGKNKVSLNAAAKVAVKDAIKDGYCQFGYGMHLNDENPGGGGMGGITETRLSGTLDPVQDRRPVLEIAWNRNNCGFICNPDSWHDCYRNCNITWDEDVPCNVTLTGEGYVNVTGTLNITGEWLKINESCMLTVGDDGRVII